MKNSEIKTYTVGNERIQLMVVNQEMAVYGKFLKYAVAHIESNPNDPHALRSFFSKLGVLDNLTDEITLGDLDRGNNFHNQEKLDKAIALLEEFIDKANNIKVA